MKKLDVQRKSERNILVTPRNRAISVQYPKNFTDYLQETDYYKNITGTQKEEMPKYLSLNSLNTTQPSTLTDLSDLSITHVDKIKCLK